MSVIKQTYQSVFDLTLQEYGSIEAVIDFCLANNISVTEELESGVELQTINFENSNTDITKYYARKKIKPDTGINTEQYELINTDDSCDLCKLFKE